MTDDNTQQPAGGVVDLEEQKDQGRPFLKSGQYSVRCIKAEKQTSKKRNPMIVFTWEIVAPESITAPNGTQTKVTGMQVMDWIVLTSNGFPKLKALHKVCHLDMKINIDAPNVRQYLGKAVNIVLKTEAKAIVDDNTNEPMLDEGGNPIIQNNYGIVRFNSPDDTHTIPAENVPPF